MPFSSVPLAANGASVSRGTVVGALTTRAATSMGMSFELVGTIGCLRISVAENTLVTTLYSQLPTPEGSRPNNGVKSRQTAGSIDFHSTEASGSPWELE